MKIVAYMAAYNLTGGLKYRWRKTRFFYIFMNFAIPVKVGTFKGFYLEYLYVFQINNN